MLLSLSSDSSNHKVGTILGIVTIPKFVELIHTIPKLKGGAQTHTQTHTRARARARPEEQSRKRILLF
jgi:hypothetical protein